VAVRQALNENPMVQLGVLAVGGVLLAFIMFDSVLKGDDSSGSTATTETVAPAAGTEGAAVAPAATTDPAAATGTTAPPADTGTVAPPATTAPPADTGSADGLLPGKGLPKDLLVAYAKGDAIALLVIDPKAQGSKRLKRAVESNGVGDVEVFVVDVNDIAKYSLITQGVAVNRAPALVVIKPRKLNEGAPMASVSYGFAPESYRQAIKDAFYKGGNVPAYPSGG
jgi:hypothetical protein